MRASVFPGLTSFVIVIAVELIVYSSADKSKLGTSSHEELVQVESDDSDDKDDSDEGDFSDLGLFSDLGDFADFGVFSDLGDFPDLPRSSATSGRTLSRT